MSFSTGEHDLFQLNRERFDFNIQFEQLFFSIIPSVLFIVSSLCQTLFRIRKPAVVHAPVFQLIKLGAIAIYIVLELALLIQAAIGSFHITSMFIAASALKLVAAIFMITLSVIDHSRSPRPSIVLNSYLFLTLLLDTAQARTLFLSSDGRPERTYSSIFTAALASKVGILLLEAQQKSRWLTWNREEHSPEETSGIFSLGAFFWLNKMFFVGYRKIMTIEDLYPLDSSFSAKSLHDQFSANMDYSKLQGDKFGLVKVLARTLKVPLLAPILPRLALIAFTFCQPLLIERLLNYLSNPNLDQNFGYGFIGASVFIYSGIAFSRAFYWYLHHRMRTMARSILVTETFSKATKVRFGTGDDSAALTLMSTDMERIKSAFSSLHEVWAGIIQVALAAWMLYNRLGVVFVAPIVLVIICFVGLGILINFTGDSQRAWMSGVQKRVGLTATVIASMKNLKISGITTAVGEYVHKLRVEELGAGVRIRKIFIMAALLGYIPLLIAPPLTFAFSQRSFDAAKVFTSLSFLTLLTVPLSQVFQSAPQIVSGLACLGRIQAFLEYENSHDFRQVLEDRKQDTEKAGVDNVTCSDPENAVVIENGSFGWEAEKFALQRINTRVSKSSLTMVIGPIGSGKSTLCKALLGEIPFNKGSLVLGSRFPHVGYCDQSAFLCNGSIRDNIVGFCPFNDERYTEVIKATALEYDLAILPQGDQTNVGSDGISLSGGQKQRVSLARALYLQCELLVLDDVFSGLDADTERHIFQQVFAPGGLLRRRRSTVLLCTHSIRHLPAADYIITLGDGTIAQQGSFNELMASEGYVQRLGLGDSSHIGASSEEAGSKNSVSESQSPLLNTTTNIASNVPDTDASRQMGDKKVYMHYLRSMGLIVATYAFFFAALWGFFTNFPTIWLKYWTDNVSSGHSAHSYKYYSGIYALLQICGLISLLLLGITLYVFSVKRAGAKIHREALHTLIRAPLSFYTKTDTGVVVNLFSQDLNLIDTELPDATLNTLFCVFQALGQAAVMLTSSLYLAVSYPILGILLYAVQKFYLRTSRQLRLLDLESKSPLYTHFLDTLRGITTLRAFGFLPDDVRKNARLIDTSQRPAYFLLMIQEWLNLVFDLVVMIMAVVLTTLAVRLHSNSGFAGASLYTLISFGENLSGIVVFYTRLETSIGAISRLKTFNETVKPEDREEEEIIPVEEWPQRGVIELKGISACYDAKNEDDDTPNMALRDIHLTIAAGEKIAICGRSGSGKSSLIAFLLKLLDPVSSTASNAFIDNTPLHRINRTALRQQIIAVPQEAVFLPDGSSFQANLDPSEVSTPAECQAVLSTVQLWQFVQDRGGLEAGMSPGTLSAGQRQLFSLGRALLRCYLRARNSGVRDEGSNGGILLLDEVSASVDVETERVMQAVIEREFAGYTVVAVSHRLDMVMDFDRVVVMDKGEIVEVGNPKTLAGQVGTKFGELLRAAGG